MLDDGSFFDRGPSVVFEGGLETMVFRAWKDAGFIVGGSYGLRDVLKLHDSFFEAKKVVMKIFFVWLPMG